MAMLAEAGAVLALSVGPWLDEASARDIAGDAPGPVLYLRWMGSPPHGREMASLMAERNDEIRAWAERIASLHVPEVYAFFNDDYQGHGPASARRLQSLLGQTPVSPVELSPQTELFE
jgi:uncharacterized protein YecE (DUF72 family)